ncbi:hypothetical protein [Vacuolonema iberomarrocanum]|uniref:hypothetical protein n=1 Tax=Vacuolonema iberomarrocanum TaxID=3454632 RepID=UPI0019E06DBA|nr:hypothetical protein [filamentous cyanobacterium LEGE 07170]
MKVRLFLPVYLLGAGAIALNPVLSKAQESRDLSQAFQLPDTSVAPTAESAKAEPEPDPETEAETEMTTATQPLPIPPTAAAAPVEHPSSQDAPLPPPPPLPEMAAMATAPPPPPTEPLSANNDLATIPPPPAAEVVPLELAFGGDLPVGGEGTAIAAVEPTSVPPTAPVAPVEPMPKPVLSANPSTESLFVGGAESVVARVVGSAEGTRTVEGLRTSAYYGHTDPGNGVWNLGSFSYQHGAASPEAADERQLQRLQRQTQTLLSRAAAFGLELTLEEQLNGIDLANQAPEAALDRGGYIDWLAEAHKLGMTGQDAIAWARTRSFLDPDTQQWNAPGLGNTVQGIARDQERRMRAIARTLAAVETEQAAPAEAVAVAPSIPATTTEASPATESPEDAGIGRLFNLDLF